jgi:hypothetical protein
MQNPMKLARAAVVFAMMLATPMLLAAEVDCPEYLSCAGDVACNGSVVFEIEVDGNAMVNGVLDEIPGFGDGFEIESSLLGSCTDICVYELDYGEEDCPPELQGAECEVETEIHWEFYECQEQYNATPMDIAKQMA